MKRAELRRYSKRRAEIENAKAAYRRLFKAATLLQNTFVVSEPDKCTVKSLQHILGFCLKNSTIGKSFFVTTRIFFTSISQKV